MEKSNKLVAEVVASNLSLINMLATIGLETDNQTTKVVVIEELRSCNEHIAEAVEVNFPYIAFNYYEDIGFGENDEE